MCLLILFLKNYLSKSQQDVLIKLFGKVYACLPPRVMRSKVMIMWNLMRIPKLILAFDLVVSLWLVSLFLLNGMLHLLCIGGLACVSLRIWEVWMIWKQFTFRFAVTKAGKLQVDERLIEGRTLAYILLELLRRLGYTFSFKKVCVGSFILEEVFLIFRRLN